jgi:hypothetical protein
MDLVEICQEKVPHSAAQNRSSPVRMYYGKLYNQEHPMEFQRISIIEKLII